MGTGSPSPAVTCRRDHLQAQQVQPGQSAGRVPVKHAHGLALPVKNRFQFVQTDLFGKRGDNCLTACRYRCQDGAGQQGLAHWKFRPKLRYQRFGVNEVGIGGWAVSARRAIADYVENGADIRRRSDHCT